VEKVEERKYWAMTAEQTLAKLESSQKGLSSPEARERLKIYGPNEIGKAGRTWFHILVSQFLDPLILVLVAAAILSAFVADITDSIMILIIVLINGILGFVQEYKSEKIVEKLREFITFKAKVWRDSKETEIDSKQLVPGDFVMLETGDKVPADIRLIETNNFSVNESVLTGEPYPVNKTPDVITAERITVQETKNIAFMGTVVAEGTAKGIVIKTGKNSEFGKTAALVKEAESESDFQRNIRAFGKMLTQVILTAVVIIFLVNAMLNKGWLDSFLFAIALAVGIIPESLPIVITIALSRGSLELAKNKVVVKKLSAIEDLGNIDVLCTDKTGTLTENQITLQKMVDVNGKENSGMLVYGMLCNSAVEEKGVFGGNPIDAAIMEYAKQKSVKATKYIKLADVPFDYNRRLMSVIVKDGIPLMITKGAIESLLKVSKKIKIGEKIVPISGYREKIRSLYNELGTKGYRVIGLSVKKIERKGSYSKKDEGDLIFIGFFVFADPPKQSARESILHAEKLGVQIKILTGDEPVSTAAVARELGLKVDEYSIITGDQIEKLSQDELNEIVNKVIIFARVDPEHKYKIIRALRANNHVVAYLGDGVNDAPALKEADVGVSVDTGTDIAKDASDIVLLHKSLEVIINGIREGRKTFSNIIKYILNTISANFGNMGTLGVISPFMNFLPLLPSQILLNNMLTDTPMIAVSTDSVDDEELKKPRKWNIKHIAKLCAFLGAISSVFDFITIFVLMYILNANAALFRTGWFLESGLTEITVVFAMRSRKFFLKSKPPSKMLLWATLLTAIITLFIIYFSPLGKLFEFVPIPLWLLGTILAIVAAYFAMTEVILLLYYKYIQKEVV
jgi:Mg2+-importing ATPase